MGEGFPGGLCYNRTMITRLRRSLLYVPCDSMKMLEKAALLPADVVLLNLEDGIAADRKEQARANAVRALRSLDFGRREVVVRINAPESATGRRDLEASVPCRPDGICLPKVERPETLQIVEAALEALEVACGLPAGTIRIHAMIESGAGMLSASAIAAASNRMAALVFGSADFASDVRCTPGPDRNELLLALQTIVAAAHAASVDAIDAPCFEIHNLPLLRRETEQARRFGFDGKGALHPNQIQPIHEVFNVKPEEVDWAERVMAELREAETRGRALATLEGSLIESPHRIAAERILRRKQLAEENG
jgi:citrate lyase subunit beta/citryl-CoA lyase